MKKPIKIYFAGAIRAGRDDGHIYSDIVELLKGFGTVLTEHVGDRTLSDKGENKPITYIFRRDINWIKSADLLVAEVTQPSTGVGYEIGFAERHNKKIVCLYRRNGEKRISGMVEGNDNLTKIYYDKIEDLLPQIKNVIACSKHAPKQNDNRSNSKGK